jgi:hypothetical protein
VHDPSVLVFDARPIKLDVWHDEPGGHDAGEVCGYPPHPLWARLAWTVRHVRHLHYRWWPYLNVKRWIVDRCDGCGQRFHWREARYSYQSTNKVWHDPCGPSGATSTTSPATSEAPPTATPAGAPSTESRASTPRLWTAPRRARNGQQRRLSKLSPADPLVTADRLATWRTAPVRPRADHLRSGGPRLRVPDMRPHSQRTRPALRLPLPQARGCGRHR